MSLSNPGAIPLQFQHMKFTAELLRRLNFLQQSGYVDAVCFCTKCLPPPSHLPRALADISGFPLHLYHDKAARNSASFLFTHLLRTNTFEELSTKSKSHRVHVRSLSVITRAQALLSLPSVTVCRCACVTFAILLPASLIFCFFLAVNFILD